MSRFASRMNVERLDRMLMVANVSPEQLARDAGLSQGTVWRARQGHRVTRSTVVAIAVTLAGYERNPAVEALLVPLEAGGRPDG